MKRSDTVALGAAGLMATAWFASNWTGTTRCDPAPDPLQSKACRDLIAAEVAAGRSPDMSRCDALLASRQPQNCRTDTSSRSNSSWGRSTSYGFSSSDTSHASSSAAASHAIARGGFGSLGHGFSSGG